MGTSNCATGVLVFWRYRSDQRGDRHGGCEERLNGVNGGHRFATYTGVDRFAIGNRR